METKSWIIVDTLLNKAVTETWDKNKAQKLNEQNSKYKAVPVQEWLSSLSESSYK